MDDFKCQIEGYTKEQLDEMITILKKRLRDIKRSENNEKMADYKRYVRLTKNAKLTPIQREIDLMWRKEQCGLITAKEREKILYELLDKLQVESQSHST